MIPYFVGYFVQGLSCDSAEELLAVVAVFDDVRQKLRVVISVPLQRFLELLAVDVSVDNIEAGRHLMVRHYAFDFVRR